MLRIADAPGSHDPARSAHGFRMVAAHNSFCSRSRRLSRDNIRGRRRWLRCSRGTGARSGAAALPLGPRRLAIACFSTQQNLSQHVKVSPQHAKPDITLITKLSTIPTAFQSVPRLQAVDGRLDSWVMLARTANSTFACWSAPCTPGIGTQGMATISANSFWFSGEWNA
jgi:hypothetical protein